MRVMWTPEGLLVNLGGGWLKRPLEVIAQGQEIVVTDFTDGLGTRFAVSVP